jgi:hypothetical protein
MYNKYNEKNAQNLKMFYILIQSNDSNLSYRYYQENIIIFGGV